MKTRNILFIILFFPSLLNAEINDFVGTWEIKVVPEGATQFPWWQEVKYPTVLVISRVNKELKIKFKDQFDYECNTKPLIVNRGNELVFNYCSGLGTKSPMAWSPIQHAKLIEGKLHGVVTTNRYLFKWLGERVN